MDGGITKMTKPTGKRKFQVEVREYLQRIVEVEAASEDEAELKVLHAYKAEEIVLDDSDFIGYEVEIYKDEP